MDDLNPRAVIGANNPPDPLDEICAQFEAAREEAANWLDGHPVENEAQMKAVDVLRKQAREWRMALEAGQKSATAPLYDAYKTEGARWKPTIEDAQRIEKGLVALVDGFKRKLAEEKAEAERAAHAEAARKMREAEEAARKANAADLEEQRAAAEAQREAEEAQRRAAAASKDTVKGMRNETRYEIEDHRKLLNWIAVNRRDDLTVFIEDWARKNHKTFQNADGLRVWQEKAAF
ncbi:hypothetical protein PARHAE_00718 [Paracoccus haematequi]|uniref:Uncharacterized protein n=1 Tax=Paracoccus haematequi TaxID=2491866 RepID=A0A3S4D9N7_9RHOB|nr:hypothetical protein [Paracoccus haematequi]VDS07541.1 hypothetical protein PARHAE_00718 [Paracoccus haematequi]